MGSVMPEFYYYLFCYKHKFQKDIFVLKFQFKSNSKQNNEPPKNKRSCSEFRVDLLALAYFWLIEYSIYLISILV